jgi:hypothetical protein
MAQHHRDGVETNLIPLDPGARDVTAGGACDVLLLFEIDGTIGMAGFGGGTCLDFDENQQISAARHDIDFRIGSGPVVSRDDRKAHLAQIAMRQVFPAPAARRFGSQDLALAELACPIAEFPEELAGLDDPVLSASSCHSMTLPRTT